jgi:crossover junction endodeoxyribonuclease RuvC
LKQASKSEIILGIDPGLSATGFGFISNGKCIDFGIVRSDNKMELGARLSKVLAVLKKKIREYLPSVCVIETLFFRPVSARSVIYSAHLRGAIFLLMYQEKVPIFEVTPAKVKQILTGNGRASKQQIGFMVQRVYNIKEKVNEHACDALAVAYSYQTIKRMKEFGSIR